MRILSQEVGCGSLGTGWMLGYSASITGNRVLLPDSIGAYSECLSAHSPSTLFIELDRPMAVCGAVNGSGWLCDGGECEFWIDYHWIGDVKYSASPTPWVNLPPGKYLLRIRNTRQNWGAHTLWLFRESELAPEGRLALTTIGCYEERRIKHALRWLHTSAAQHGIHLHVFGVGEHLESWFSAKIKRMGGWLETLRSPYTHAIYLDGTDTCVLGDEVELLKKLTGFDTPTVIGAETCPWPEMSPEWCSAFREGVPECFPQAGGWGGVIHGDKGLLATLSNIVSLRENWLAGKTYDWLMPFRHFDDDQFLWQAIFRAANGGISLDSRFKLFANMTCSNTDLHKTELVHAQGNRLVCPNGEQPSCVHFSGGGKEKFGQWLAFMGIAR